MLSVRRVFLLVVLALGTAFAQEPSGPDLMPMPASVRFGAGKLVIDGSFSIAIAGYDEPRLHRAAERMAATLSRETGIPFRAPVKPGGGAKLVIQAAGPSAPVQELGEDESYRLEITPSGAKLTAANPLGILRGLQTFLQSVQLTPEDFSVREAVIEDRPRFPWRGLMIDVARHFQPVAVLERNLDAMEAVKLNVFHWHLSDNQGFRVESRKLPKLHELGSEGQYYTQEQIKQILEYARDRGIRVIPEFDMPGHSTAWLVAYPELASLPGPYRMEYLSGVFDPAMDPTEERVYKHLDRFIGEMAKLFPDAYFHVGGDEVNGVQWATNPRIQAFRKAHGLADNAALQAYFSKRVQALVAKHHKIMIGWDEILQPGLPKESIIQSWRGPKGIRDAVSQGYRGIRSHGYYLDLSQPAAFHYSVDPVGGEPALSPEQEKLVLGGEACMWSELTPPETIDSRIWPRMAAIAERFWSPQSVTSVPSMYRRMLSESLRLEWLPTGLTHRAQYQPMLERLAASGDTYSLQILADAVEPVKEYQRQTERRRAIGRVYTTLDAYNRLVDTVPPESMVKIRFEQLVDRLLSRTDTPADRAELQGMLQEWSSNDALLQPAIRRSALLKEIAPLSTSLSVVGTAGLHAFEYLQAGSAPSADWVRNQLTALDEAGKPKAELSIVVATGVRRLLHALEPKEAAPPK